MPGPEDRRMNHRRAQSHRGEEDVAREVSVSCVSVVTSSLRCTLKVSDTWFAGLIAWALNNPLMSSSSPCRWPAVGVYSFLHVNVEAYPDPAPAIVEVVAPLPRRLRRGGRAPGHHPAGSDPGRHARPEVHPQQVAVRPVAPAHPVRVRHRLQRRPARRSSTACSSPSRCRPASRPQLSPESPTGEIYRYTLEPPQGPARPRHLHAQRSQGAAGLGAGARVPPRAAHRRRHQLRRHGQALRDPPRPGPPAPLRHHPRPAAERPDQQQRQRRRRLRHPGPRRHDRAQRRPVRRRRGPGPQGARHEGPRSGRRRGTGQAEKETPESRAARGTAPHRHGRAAVLREEDSAASARSATSSSPRSTTADPRRRRGRGRPASSRRRARRAGRGRRPPDAPGPGRP